MYSGSAVYLMTVTSRRDYKVENTDGGVMVEKHQIGSDQSRERSGHLQLSYGESVYARFFGVRSHISMLGGSTPISSSTGLCLREASNTTSFLTSLATVHADIGDVRRFSLSSWMCCCSLLRRAMSFVYDEEPGPRLSEKRCSMALHSNSVTLRQITSSKHGHPK